MLDTEGHRVRGCCTSRLAGDVCAVAELADSTQLGRIIYGAADKRKEALTNLFIPSSFNKQSS